MPAVHRVLLAAASYRETCASLVGALEAAGLPPKTPRTSAHSSLRTLPQQGLDETRSSCMSMGRNMLAQPAKNRLLLHGVGALCRDRTSPYQTARPCRSRGTRARLHPS